MATIRNSTIKNIQDMLEDIWVSSKDNKLPEVLSYYPTKYHTSPAYIKVLKDDLKWVQLYNGSGKYKWATEPPTRDMVIRLIQTVNEAGRGRMRTKAEEEKKQITENLIPYDEAITRVNNAMKLAEKYEVPINRISEFVKDLMDYIYDKPLA